MISFSVQRDSVAKSAIMTAGASCAWNINTMCFVAFVMTSLCVALLLLNRLATDHGTHERTLHPVRMSRNKGTLFRSFCAAVAGDRTFAFFNIIAH